MMSFEFDCGLEKNEFHKSGFSNVDRICQCWCNNDSFVFISQLVSIAEISMKGNAKHFTLQRYGQGTAV